jgi:hypothetical protein
MPSRLAGFMTRHPVGVVLAAGLGAVFALLYTATHLAFDSNRLDLVSAGDHYKELDAAFSREGVVNLVLVSMISEGCGANVYTLLDFIKFLLVRGCAMSDCATSRPLFYYAS